MAQRQKYNGEVFKIFEAQVKTERFSTREIVLKEGDRYYQYPKFQFNNSDADRLDGFSVGDLVTIEYELNGKPFEKTLSNGKTETLYFTNLVGKNIYFQKEETETEAEPKPITAADSKSNFEANPKANYGSHTDVKMPEDTEDELPF